MILSNETFIAILFYSIPMIISPGPGNTILATAGAQFGVRGTLPFWSGFEAANFVWCIAYGTGLSAILVGHPSIAQALKWLGVAYTLYLAYSFFKSSSLSDGQDVRALNFFDGFLSVSLNPKIHQSIFILISQFLPADAVGFSSIIQISVLFTSLCILCHAPWIYAGRALFFTFRSPSAIRIQGYIFGSCMILVALYVAIR